jgi:hypothetical protein
MSSGQCPIHLCQRWAQVHVLLVACVAKTVRCCLSQPGLLVAQQMHGATASVLKLGRHWDCSMQACLTCPAPTSTYLYVLGAPSAAQTAPWLGPAAAGHPPLAAPPATHGWPPQAAPSMPASSLVPAPAPAWRHLLLCGWCCCHFCVLLPWQQQLLRLPALHLLGQSLLPHQHQTPSAGPPQQIGTPAHNPQGHCYCCQCLHCHCCCCYCEERQASACSARSRLFP